MDGDRWGATETRLTTDIRRAVRRELDPKKRPKRTPHDFARIRNFLMDLAEGVINQQPPMSHLNQSEILRQNLSSFMPKNFSDPGKRLRLNLVISGNNRPKTFTRLRQANLICPGPLEIYPAPYLFLSKHTRQIRKRRATTTTTYPTLSSLSEKITLQNPNHAPSRRSAMVAVWVCQGQVRRAKLWHSNAGCSKKSPRTNAEFPRTARGPMQQLGLKRVF